MKISNNFIGRTVLSLLCGAVLYGCGGAETPATTPPTKLLAGSTFCGASQAWVSGQNYAAGDTVIYNGKYYRATYANPGYNPTVSTYYWSVFTCSGTTPTPTPACSTTTWTTGVNYPIGTVLRYAANGTYYKVVNAATGYSGSGGTNPTVSTYIWNLATCSPTAPASGKIIGGYWPNWPANAIRVRDVHPNYNLIYLFHAQPVGGAPGTTGAVFFNMPGNARGAATNFYADIQHARKVQGRKIILSVGGAKNGMSFPNRTKSQTFVNSIVSLYNRFGGFDGMDWNTFEADQAPDTSEMVWISLELKRRYPGFLITSPPAPWSQRDLAFCKAMVTAGAMDYCAPQYYDGPGLNDPNYVNTNIDQWVRELGASRVVVGEGVWNADNYMSSAQAVSAWNMVEAKHPTIRGGFNWAISTDETQGWPYANNVAPLIRN